MKAFQKKFIDNLLLNFPNPKMENEYISIKQQNSLSDFLATSIFMVTLNILVIIPGFPNKDWPNVIIGFSSMTAVITLVIFRNFFVGRFHYLTLLQLLFWNISRFFIMKYQYSSYSGVNMFFQGYLYSSVQWVLLNRIQSIPIRMFTIAASLAIRYGVLTGIIDKNAYNTVSMIRQIVIDCFIAYILYSSEKTQRKIFQHFFENRDELSKFKELLADSLPQSVTVWDYQTKKHHFSNNTFFKTFGVEKSEEHLVTESFLPEESNQNQVKKSPKALLSSLLVDPGTLRETGSPQENGSIFGSSIPSTNTLEELLDKLTRDTIIKNKALSVIASENHNGKQRTFEIILKKVKWNTVDAIAIILNDTTYQENLLALKLANINKDKIIATVSHELRTPLHGIIGLLEIAETKVTDPEVHTHLSLCKDNAHLLSSLVNSLLDLQQLSTGKLKLNLAKINLFQTLKNVVQLFQFQCEQKGLAIDLEIQEDVPSHIITDENRLKQILINLIGNALKFTFKGGVKIEVAQEDPEEDECLLISVSDTGIGIREEDVGKLFKMYGKLEDNYGVNRNGVGLGLTISSTLAALLNGKNHDRGIEVESQFGRGSTFSFKILKKLQHENESKYQQKRIGKSKGKNNDDIANCSVEKERLMTEELIFPKAENDISFIETKEDSVAVEFSVTALPITIESKIASYTLKRSDLPKENESVTKAILSSKTLSQNIFPINEDRKGRARNTTITRSASENIMELEFGRNNRTTTDLSTCKDRAIILVVDDNPFNILVAKSLLKDLGYNVRAAASGHEAINIVKSSYKEGIQIKVIFLDCQMPIMDGYETAKALMTMMEKGEVPKAPLLAWTANNGEQDIRRCYECGMTGYLSKPTTKENILKVIPK